MKGFVKDIRLKSLIKTLFNKDKYLVKVQKVKMKTIFYLSFNSMHLLFKR